MTQSPFPPPWEGGAGPADPALSASFGSYTGSGYGTRGGTGEVGTINPGLSTPVGQNFPPAQPRFYLQGNNLYILDNITGNSYFVSLSGIVPVPAIYPPT